jgi:hypothetical protein
MPPIERSPAPSGTRWVVRRKVALIEAVRSGEITLDEGCRKYQLSPEEFNGWISAYEKHGAPGLRVTRFQIYRPLGRKDTGEARLPRNQDTATLAFTTVARTA